MKKVPILFVLWSILGTTYEGIFHADVDGGIFAESPRDALSEILGQRGKEEPVYGIPSHLFESARKKYTKEYLTYASYYAVEGHWRKFSAPGIPAETNEYVAAYIREFQSKRRRDFLLWLRRAGRYTPLIRRILIENGLPGELVCLAMIESGFDPFAVSDAKARGLWQFMPETARRYGLRVDGWVDERLDVEKSTVAASRYLLHLFRRYGTWDLTIAAYNSGESRITQITRRTGSEKFWDLAGQGRFHLETRYHVIKFQAAVAIMRDLDGYGFVDAELEAPLLFERIDVPTGTSLEALAEVTGISEIELIELNPQLIRKETPPDEPLYSLKVPVGMGERVRESLHSKPIS